MEQDQWQVLEHLVRARQVIVAREQPQAVVLGLPGEAEPARIAQAQYRLGQGVVTLPGLAVAGVVVYFEQVDPLYLSYTKIKHKHNLRFTISPKNAIVGGANYSCLENLLTLIILMVLLVDDALISLVAS